MARPLNGLLHERNRAFNKNAVVHTVSVLIEFKQLSTVPLNLASIQRLRKNCLLIWRSEYSDTEYCLLPLIVSVYTLYDLLFKHEKPLFKL